MIEHFRCYINKDDGALMEKGTDREVVIHFQDGDDFDYNRLLDFLAGCSQFGDLFYDPGITKTYISISGTVEEKTRDLVTINFNVSTKWCLVDESCEAASTEDESCETASIEDEDEEKSIQDTSSEGNKVDGKAD